MTNEANIITVDLKDFDSQDPAARARFVEDIGRACNDIGFVAISNHYLSDELQARAYEQVSAFFSLPMDTKHKYIVEGARGQRGYSSMGTEQAVGAEVPDLKEFWQHGREAVAPNPSVEELPAFSEVCHEIYDALERTGRTLLRGIALYLNLEEDYFEPRVEGGQSIIRCIHYPPITQEPTSAVRAAQHEDINLITLLMGASAGGLEILTKSGEWLGITALPGQLVVNIGDMLQRLTNGVLKSTTHRVVNPPREQWGESRFSIPFFLHPRADVSLACLPQTVTADNPKQFEDMTAGEYLNERLEAIRKKST